ncbi:MAG: EAL domain-containing protein [Woeseiaceae bacterium]|nr:EAL domain-containing protein [Woeseiaceae bacterium]
MVADPVSLSTRRNFGNAKGLLHSLIPRAQCFCFYDLKRNCAWSSDGVEDYETDGYVEELPADLFDEDDAPEYLRHTLKSGRTLLVLPVRVDLRDNLGLLVVVFSRNAGKSSWFNPSMLHGVLAPAVDMLAASLRVGDELDSRARQISDVKKELTLVYEIDEKIHGTSKSHAGLAQLVGQSGRFLNICYSVLLIPSKRIRVSATHSSWKKVNRKVLDRYLAEQLMPKIEGKRSPVIFEMPAVDGADGASEQEYQALLCPLTDPGGNIEGVLAQLGRVTREPFDDGHRRFMSHIVRKVEYVIERSFDAMTGLMNRAAFESQLRESWKALKESDGCHQLLYFDLDNLELVNDTFGRKAGDEVIQRFAAILEEDLPRSAVVSRLTGDDFCVLLTDASQDEAMEFAKDVRERSKTLRYLEGDKSLQVTMSAGITAYKRSSGHGGRALTTARLACDSAKDHGRDRIEIFDQTNESMIQRHDDMQLVSEIQKSLDGDAFQLQVQPIEALDREDDRQRYEVLLRMRGDDGEAVATSDLLSAAERYQIMPQIDRWVVSTTMARLMEYADAVGEANAIFSINLSGQSLGDDEILDFIEQEFEATGVPPESIGFEVTESAAVSNLAAAQQFIDALHERGCRISLDDFGAGLSSFAYLKNFRVDTLKIDGSFIRDICENQISESMVAAITQVAKVMDLETVAEYVQDDATRDLLAEIGVQFVQGHFVGRPQPLDDLLESLAEPAESTG